MVFHSRFCLGPEIMKGIRSAAKNASSCNTALMNTALLIERISILKPVIKTVGEAQICIENGQLVRALRKLHDAWERTRKLPHHIRLVKSLADNIPFMKSQLILEAKRGTFGFYCEILKTRLEKNFDVIKIKLRNAKLIVCETQKRLLEHESALFGSVLACESEQFFVQLSCRAFSVGSSNSRRMICFYWLV